MCNVATWAPHISSLTLKLWLCRWYQHEDHLISKQIGAINFCSLRIYGMFPKDSTVVGRYIAILSSPLIMVRQRNLLSRIHNQLTVRKELTKSRYLKFQPSQTQAELSVWLLTSVTNFQTIFETMFCKVFLMNHTKQPIGLIWVHNFLVIILMTLFNVTLLWNFLVDHLKYIYLYIFKSKASKLNVLRRLWTWDH